MLFILLPYTNLNMVIMVDVQCPLCICQHVTTHCAMLAYICCIKSISMVCIAASNAFHQILHVDWLQGRTNRRARR